MLNIDYGPLQHETVGVRELRQNLSVCQPGRPSWQPIPHPTQMSGPTGPK